MNQTHSDKTHEHSSIATYWKIGVILFVITFLEVLYPYATGHIRILDPFYMPILGTMSLFKFALVCGYFMHLKYDPAILRRILYASLMIAIIVVVALMLLYGIGI